MGTLGQTKREPWGHPKWTPQQTLGEPWTHYLGMVVQTKGEAGANQTAPYIGRPQYSQQPTGTFGIKVKGNSLVNHWRTLEQIIGELWANHWRTLEQIIGELWSKPLENTGANYRGTPEQGHPSSKVTETQSKNKSRSTSHLQTRRDPD